MCVDDDCEGGSDRHVPVADIRELEKTLKSAIDAGRSVSCMKVQTTASSRTHTHSTNRTQLS